MKTKCEKCKKEFELDYSTVYVGNEYQIPHTECVVVKCPHCKKRTEI